MVFVVFLGGYGECVVVFVELVDFVYVWCVVVVV